MSQGATRNKVASAIAKNVSEGSAPLESLDLKGRKRTVDEPNQEILMMLLEQLEQMNRSLNRIEQCFVQLVSNDLRQSISKERFVCNLPEDQHGRH